MFHPQLFRSRKPSRTTVIGGTMVLALAMGGTAYAAIPNSSTGVITGCYQTFLGNLRVIDAQAGQQCNLFEKKLDWNQAGVPGPKGDRGSAGPPGPPGPAGISAVTVRTKEFSLPPSSVTSQTAACMPGEVATGGGVSLIGGRSGTVKFLSSFPIGSPTPTGWDTEAENASANEFQQLVFYAVCARVG